MKNLTQIRKFSIAATAFLVIAMPLVAYATNDITFSADTDFTFNTGDTAVSTTLTVASGSNVTALDVEGDYMDVTIDNSSTITVTTENATTRFLRINYHSGSASAYTISPTCPTSTLTLTGTGAQSVQRIQVMTTTGFPNGCGGGGGGGGGGGSAGGSGGGASATPSTAPSSSPSYTVPVTGFVYGPTTIHSTDLNASYMITPGTKVTDDEGKPYKGILYAPEVVSVSSLAGNLPAGFTARSALVVTTFGDVHFSKDITLTVPLPEGTDTSTVKIYFYNTKNSTYELVGDGGVVSPDGKSISVQTNHLSTYVAADKGTGKTADLAYSGFFKDAAGEWSAEFAEKLHTKCAIDGYKDADGKALGSFKPNSTITRRELVKMVLQCKYQTVTAATAAPFPDVDLTMWGANEIAQAKTDGMVAGDPQGNFLPDNNVIRAEAAKIIELAKNTNDEIAGSDLSVLSVFTDLDMNAWYTHFVAFGNAKMYFSGYKGADGQPNGKWGPGNNLTRGEAAKIIANVFAL